MGFLTTLAVWLVIFIIIFFVIFMFASFFEPKPGDGSKADRKLQAEADSKMEKAFDGTRDLVTYDVSEHQNYPSRGELIERAHQLGYEMTGSSDSKSFSTLIFERRGSAVESEANRRSTARPRLHPEP